MFFKTKTLSLISKVFMLTDRLLGYPFERKRFKKRTGYKLNLKDPKSFNQKVCWLKLNNRSDLLPLVVDKYKVREYVRRKVGSDYADSILIPLLQVADFAEDINFSLLPNEFIVKANHGSGTNYVARNLSVSEEKVLIERVNRWLSIPYGAFKHEWAYQKVKRKIIVEDLLKDSEGNLPKDYKFHMFHGVCRMIQINEGDFWDTRSRTLSLYTPDWEPINVMWEYPPSFHHLKPEKLSEMIELAKVLSEDFKYIRVDLYLINDSIKFGELTCYPTSASSKVNPVDFDFEMGKYILI